MKRESQDQFSTAAIYLTCMPCFFFFLELCQGRRVSDRASWMVVWYVYCLHSTFPSRQPGCCVVSSLSGYNISSLTRVYFQGFVLPGSVFPAFSEHTVSPHGYELLSPSSILSVGESRSGPTIGSSCVRLSPSYYRHVWLMAIIGTSRSHYS